MVAEWNTSVGETRNKNIAYNIHAKIQEWNRVEMRAERKQLI